MNSKIIICLFSALVCFAASLDAGKSTHTLTYGDRTSDIVIHVPENYDGEGDLLLALHGYGG
jgi:poly(3-hydroxybutyrate) depolymerase